MTKNKVLVVGPDWYGYSVENCYEGFIGFAKEVEYLKYKPVQPFNSKTSILYNCAKFFYKLAVSMLFNFMLINKVLITKPDLVFVVKGETIYRSIIKFIKMFKVKIVVWWQDDPFHYSSLKNVHKYYDEFFIFDRSYIKKLENYHVKNIHYLSFAFNHNLLSEQLGEKERCFDLVFAGYASEERVSFFENIAGLGFKIKLIGSAWSKKSEKLRKMVEIIPDISPLDIYPHYLDSKIGININNKQSVEGVNCRTFELCGFGVFQLTDYRECLNELYTPGEDLQTYQSENELVDKITYYLENEQERVRIAKKGQERTLQEHTYSERMKHVCDIVFS